MRQHGWRARVGVALFGFAGLTGLATAACDSPGGGNGSVSGDATQQVGDTTQATTPTDTTVIDTTVIDTADTTDTVDTLDTSDTNDTSDTTVACTPACIPLSSAASDVSFFQFESDVVPPTLGGSTPAASRPTGTWALDEVDIYPYNTYADGILVTVEDNGATKGHAAFQGGLFMLGMDLDLYITVDIGGSTGSNTAKSTLTMGGCDSFVGATLRGDFEHCANGFPDGISAPGVMPYAYDSSGLSIGITLTREMLIAMLPVDQQANGEFAIVGDLTLVAHFTH